MVLSPAKDVTEIIQKAKIKRTDLNFNINNSSITPYKMWVPRFYCIVL